MASRNLELARDALAHGDVLIAYDLASKEAATDPRNHEARFVAALALARSGASDGAQAEASDLADEIATGGNARASLQADVAALLARLAKDDGLAHAGPERRTRLLRAADMYERVADLYGGYHPCINASTLRFLAGDTQRACELAGRAIRGALDAPDVQPSDGYWRAVTIAEAHLVLGERAAAQSALEDALAQRPNLASLAATRRQLRLLCDARAEGYDALAAIDPPTVLHYCGHRVDDAKRRFTDETEDDVAARVRKYLATHRVESGYGSLASGADIVIAEALLHADARLHVILPFDIDEFDRISVSPAGGRWSARFRACADRASSVIEVSDSRLAADELFGLAARIAMGHTLNRARFIDAPAVQLAVWDGHDGPDGAGTAHDVSVWRAAGSRTYVVPVPATKHPIQQQASIAPMTEIGAILFADFRDFSQLRTEQFPAFIDIVFSGLAAVMDSFGAKVRWSNTWGDAVAAVFDDVTVAAECAIAFHETVRTADLDTGGLPTDLQMRISGHAGAVLVKEDPITRRLTYWGRELTRAARIEPRTPAGEVYVSDAFAALLALEPGSGFASDYVGRVTTAKDFETIPMYRLRRV